MESWTRRRMRRRRRWRRYRGVGAATEAAAASKSPAEESAFVGEVGTGAFGDGGDLTRRSARLSSSSATRLRRTIRARATRLRRTIRARVSASQQSPRLHETNVLLSKSSRDDSTPMATSFSSRAFETTADETKTRARSSSIGLRPLVPLFAKRKESVRARSSARLLLFSSGRAVASVASSPRTSGVASLPEAPLHAVGVILPNALVEKSPAPIFIASDSSICAASSSFGDGIAADLEWMPNAFRISISERWYLPAMYRATRTGDPRTRWACPGA